VFADGYQAHAATETCPGHSTILTGSFPARTGIVANDWVDFAAARADKVIYCAEDETVAGSTSAAYSVSPVHLRAQTLGDRMKSADPRSRVVAVSGKDRGAVMMAGHKADQVWFWNGQTYTFLPGLTPLPAGAQVNAAVADALSRPRAALEVPALCQPKDRAIPIGAGKSVGTFHFARAAGDTKLFRASPEFDGATLAMAAAMFQQMQLGRGPAPDLLAVSLSATDYVGHTYGPGGVEMCLQLTSLDADLGGFFRLLDDSGVDYAVVLTADHGGLDLPERQRLEGVPQAQRLLPSGTVEAIGTEVSRRLGLSEPAFIGDWYLVPSVSPARRAEALALAKQLLLAQGQVETVFNRAEVEAQALPTSAPEKWTLLERFRASYDRQRSGDLFLAYKQYVTAIVDPTVGAVATHGTVWDYDRKVPILFWWKGIAPEDQATSALTVDILPTLASLIGLSVPANEIDGHCRDIIAGSDDNCR
jgi:predicted AlkP superfamily pyrophosphatase or phosphodiesterase